MPIKAMKRPIPTDVAILREGGMALTIFSRIPRNVSVQPHARGHHDRGVGPQSHEYGRQACHDAGDCDEGPFVHAGVGKNVGVDKYDVGGCEKGREACDDLSADIGLALSELEQVFQHSPLLSGLLRVGLSLCSTCFWLHANRMVKVGEKYCIFRADKAGRGL
jgi:hypothetical protein